jgi:hypothetical protein
VIAFAAVTAILGVVLGVATVRVLSLLESPR